MPIDYEDLYLVELSADESQYDTDEHDGGDEDYSGHDLDDDLPVYPDEDWENEDAGNDETVEGDDDDDIFDDDDDDSFDDSRPDVMETRQYREDERGFRYTTDEYIEELDSAWDRDESDFERIARGD
jgi:hypothetical protein